MKVVKEAQLLKSFDLDKIEKQRSEKIAILRLHVSSKFYSFVYKRQQSILASQHISPFNAHIKSGTYIQLF